MQPYVSLRLGYIVMGCYSCAAFLVWLRVGRVSEIWFGERRKEFQMSKQQCGRTERYDLQAR
jgi:hypothetical protein